MKDLMTHQQQTEFDNISRNMMDWLKDNTHPHMTVIITSTYAELLEGQRSVI